MTASLHFPPFHLDIPNAQLRRGRTMLPLRPKTFAVLQYLVERPGRLVTKNELLDAVWLDAVVSESALKVCIRELREALSDGARTPRFIETVHKRGYRFIAPVAANAAPVPSSEFQVPSKSRLRTPHSGLRTQDSALRTPHSVLVGRAAELAQLHRWCDQALTGQRQVVFITGEPGIGKTTLIEAFLAQLEARGWGLGTSPLSSQAPSPKPLAPRIWIAHGQCIEHYGSGEAFLPVLEGLGRLCRQPGGDRLVALLREHAPSWLLQLPGLLSATERTALQQDYMGMARHRMLRELVVGLEMLTADTPMLLVLEDLHWSDHSTLDFLNALARRRQPARLLVIGAYRPGDALGSEHPLAAVAQDLLLHRHGVELPLHPLSEAAVAAYLAARFPGAAFLTALTPLLHWQTGGNPLFLVNVVDHLVAQESIGARGRTWSLRQPLAVIQQEIPRSFRQAIEAQLARLSALELRVLRTASVAGVEFSTAAVAAGVEEPLAVVEECCRLLARRHHLLYPAGEGAWPDGAVTTSFAFTHTLYHDALYRQTPPEQRGRLHRRIGERLEAGYGADVGQIAAQLAMHFEQGRDLVRAVAYLHEAGTQAVRRYAYHEAIAYLTKGAQVLQSLPASPERDQQELALQGALCIPLLNTKGFAAPEVEQTHTRALDLCRRIGETPQLFQLLEGLHSFYAVQGNLPVAYDLAQQLLRIAQRTRDALMLVEGHHTTGCMELRRAQLTLARSHLEQAVILYDPQRGAEAIQYSGHDPKVCCLGFLGVTLWYSGFPDQAVQQAQAGLAFAQELAHPYTTVLALTNLAWVYLLRGEDRLAEAQAEAVLTLAHEQGYLYYLALGAMLRGWARLGQDDNTGGKEEVRQGLTGLKAMGSGTGRLEYFLLRADAELAARRVADARHALTEAEALIQRYGERYLEAELYRLRSAVVLQEHAERGVNGRHGDAATTATREAEEWLHQAIAIAQQQQAKMLELRAVRSLCQLWRQQGKYHEARQHLSAVYNWFTEGWETAELQKAERLLEELEARD